MSGHPTRKVFTMMLAYAVGGLLQYIDTSLHVFGFLLLLVVAVAIPIFTGGHHE